MTNPAPPPVSPPGTSPAAAPGANLLPWEQVVGQSRWLRVGLLFLLFYFGEAVLFWQGLALAKPLMDLPLFVPLLYPLGYWGLFGAGIYWVMRKSADRSPTPLQKRFQRWQNGLLTVGITVGVVGVAFVVMQESQSTKLGHVALFFALFLAAAVLGAQELNLGWLAAAALWLITAIGLDFYPDSLDLIPRINDADVWIGLATALGFFLIGALPRRVDLKQLIRE